MAIKDGSRPADLFAEQEEEDDDDDDELFEIDIDAVNSSSISGSDCCSGDGTAGSSAGTTIALFANCLLPITHVSAAVPMPTSSSASCSVVSLEEQLMLYRLHRRNFQHFSFGEVLCLTDDDE